MKTLVIALLGVLRLLEISQTKNVVSVDRLTIVHSCGFDDIQVKQTLFRYL